MLLNHFRMRPDVYYLFWTPYTFRCCSYTFSLHDTIDTILSQKADTEGRAFGSYSKLQYL